MAFHNSLDVTNATTSSLPNGMAGQSYSVTLSASGGTLPYTWSLTGSQQLPSGLSLNASTGVISGTPTTAAGPVTLNVEATDHSAPPLISNVALSLTIDSATVTSGPVYQYTAQFDHAGNVTSYDDSVMGTWIFSYDHLNRLASGVPSTGVYSGQSRQLCMDYDSFGNRTQADLQTTACNPNPTPSVTQSSYDPSTASYNAANHVTWLQNLAPSGLTYDGSGNVTYDGINYYAYDAEGRICATETWPLSGGVAAYGYLYDGEGRRVAKGTVNPAPNGQAPSCDPSSNGFTLTESYVLGQGGERLTTMEWTGGASGTGSWQSTNVYGAGKLIATYDSTANPAYTPTNSLPAQITALHFQLADPLGTRRIQTNSVGEAELDCQSLPFGDQLNCFPDPRAPNDNPAEDATGSLTSIHFTGKERDAESGLDYFGARYYASNMGRFMSPDSVGGSPENPQSWNLYGYVNNNPLTNIDPDGHACVVQTRTGDNTETVSIASQGDCSGVTVGDGQSATYVNGTVNLSDVSAGAGGHSIDIGFTSYDGSSSGVQNSSSAPYPDSPNTDPNWGNNVQGYATLGAANKAVNYAAIGTAAVFGGVAAAAVGPEAAVAVGRWGLQRLAIGASSPALLNLINRLYQAQDEISGGTAGAVRNEVMTGEYINGGHSIKAAEMITALQRLIGSGELSGSDQTIAAHIISDLKNSLGR